MQNPVRRGIEQSPLLVQHYLHRYSRELGKDVQAIAPEALELLRGYGWPGNVRELQSVLKQALLQAAGAIVGPDFLPASLLKRNHPTDVPVPDESSPLLHFIDQQL